MTTPRYGDGSDVTFANFSKDALREGTFYKVTSLPSPLRAAPPAKGFFARGAGGWAYGTASLASDHKMLWY